MLIGFGAKFVSLMYNMRRLDLLPDPVVMHLKYEKETWPASCSPQPILSIIYNHVTVPPPILFSPRGTFTDESSNGYQRCTLDKLMCGNTRVDVTLLPVDLEYQAIGLAESPAATCPMDAEGMSYWMVEQDSISPTQLIKLAYSRSG